MQFEEVAVHYYLYICENGLCFKKKRYQKKIRETGTIKRDYRW